MLIADALHRSHDTPGSEAERDLGASPQPPQPVPALPGIDCPAAVARLGDDPELYLALVEEFVDTQPAATAELAPLLAQARWQDAERVAHTTKSVAATVGATHLAVLAKGLENALREGEKHAGLASQADAILAELARVVGELKALLAGQAPGPATAPAPAAPAAPVAVTAPPTAPAPARASLEPADGRRPVVLAVDDAPTNLAVIRGVLGDDYVVVTADSGPATLALLASRGLPDLILLDVTMPQMDGYEVCRRLKDDTRLAGIPVIFLTARNEEDDEKRGLDLGGVDYITKPVNAAVVRARVRNHLLLKQARDVLRDQNAELERLVAARTREIVEVQDATIFALATLAETRDNETGNHIRRTQFYVKALALELRRHPSYAAALPDAEIEMLFKSAPLHDIGKVGVPDAVLCKPGTLDAEEWVTMRMHPAHGRDAIAAAEAMLSDEHSFLRCAREIAFGHHERWDGSGYPQGLAGEAIPLSARLMAVADVYDALISRRVYKPPMTHAEAVAIVVQERGRQFDPAVVDAFLAAEGEFRAIAGRFRDT